MLEGLEIEIISKSIIQKENEIFRIDSEFQLKEYIKSIDKIKERPYKNFDEYIELLTDGKHGGVELTDEGVIFLRTTNIKENKIDLSDLRYISNEESNETKRAEFSEKDLLLTTIGTIGLCVKVPKDFPRATINQNLVRIVLKNKNYSSIVCCFLNSKFGRHQTLRFGAGNVYQMINYPNLKKIKIPKFTPQLSKIIDNLYVQSESKSSEAKSNYTKAETILLDKIGLQSFEAIKEPVNIKGFRESFGSTGRLDAEYYQKKYDELELRITSQNYVRIKDIRSDNFRGLQPIYFENGNLDVINSKHILDNTLDYDNFEKTSLEYWEKQEKARVYKGDILTYTTGANIGRTQVYLKQSKALASNHVNIIRLKQENPFYIGFVLNSLVGRLQTEKRSAGSAQAELYPKDLDEFLIPIIDLKKQKQITKLVEESFKLKAESERLLEVAKQVVEMAIEVDEETAMEFINKEGI